MSETQQPPVLVNARFPNRWALFPVGLLGILVSVQAVLFSLSRNDPSFAVEPEYYQKAVSWDKQVEQRAHNARLGWQPAVEFTTKDGAPALQVTLTDATGAPVADAAVGAIAFPNARASAIQTPPFRQTTAGTYVAPLNVVIPGAWEVRLTASHADSTFTHTARLDVPATK